MGKICCCSKKQKNNENQNKENKEKINEKQKNLSDISNQGNEIQITKNNNENETDKKSFKNYENTIIQNEENEKKTKINEIKKKIEKPIEIQSKSDYELFFNQETKLLDLDGIEKIGTELNIDIDTNMFFPYFLYKCGIKKFEKITLQEYETGLNYFKVSSIKQINKNCWKMKFTGEDFKNFYKYLYELNAIKKIVPFEVIEVYFPQLFQNISFVKDFVNFLKKKGDNNGLNKDQWECFLELVKLYQNNYPKNYLVDDSWPILFDDFYYDYCKNHGIEVKKKDEDDYF